MKLPYGRQEIDDDDVRAVVEALRSDWLTQGPAVERFERALEASTGARHAVAVANGTVALHLACLAAELGPGDEGITTPITFAASATCLAYVGATPRFVDIERDTFNLDATLLAAAITPRTRAIIPVHFGGLPCDLGAVRAVADRHGLVVIADACHALGALLDGKPIGGTGLAELIVLSFHPVKHVTTAEGGAVLTDDDTLARRLRRLRHHGIVNTPDEIAPDQGGWYYEIQLLGINARLSDLHAALGASQLARLDRFVARRRELVARYRAALAGVPGLRLQAEPAGRTHSYHLQVIWLDPAQHDRRRVYDELRAQEIFTQVHYIPVHFHPLHQRLSGAKRGDFPVAEEYYAGALSLPLFPAMRDEDVDRVTAALLRVLGR